jgi:ATP-dependent RNA helicase DDX55/SPB4
VGRTARAGREGRSLTFLLPQEDTYIEFLRLKHVPMSPLPDVALPEPERVAAVLESAKALARKDREVLEKGTRAFTSFIRAYKEHQCQYIFRFNKLDLGAVARSYALLRLPRMPEIVHHAIPVVFENEDVKTSAIPFKDKARELARQRRLKAMEEERKREQEAAPMAEDRKAPRGQAEGSKEEEKRQRKKRKGRHQQIVEEWEELAREERLFKKLRKKKITEEEYERQLWSRPDEAAADGEGAAMGGGRDESAFSSDGESDRDDSSVRDPAVTQSKTAAPAKRGHMGKGSARGGRGNAGRARGRKRGYGGR